MKRLALMFSPLWISGILILVLSGCSSTGARRSADAAELLQSPGEPVAPLAGVESLPPGLGKKGSRDHRVAYTVGPDDVLQVEVRQHAEIGGQFTVSPEGAIFISLIGSVEVEDATTGEIARRIEERLKEYIRDPQVGVSVVGYNSKKIYVLGQVMNPGEYSMKGNTLSVRDAVVQAGLPLDTAILQRVAVITPDEENPQVILVDLNKVLYKGIMRENVDLKPGDLVVVHRNVFAQVGALLDQLLGPTQRLRALESIALTVGGNRRR